jgi:PleD family two-component response regulator
MRILIADDSSMIRLMLVQTLHRLGHEVVATCNGLEAWAAYQKEYFPVVNSDWHMPQIDGLGLATLIRSRPADRYSYVILITSDDAAGHYEDGIRAGADDFLQKPFDERHLAARLLVAARIVRVQNHTRRLEALMAVCSYCKCVRTDANKWVHMEAYAAQRFGVQSSHGICPTCVESKVKPELAALGIQMSDPALLSC